MQLASRDFIDLFLQGKSNISEIPFDGSSVVIEEVYRAEFSCDQVFAAAIAARTYGT